MKGIPSNIAGAVALLAVFASIAAAGGLAYDSYLHYGEAETGATVSATAEEGAQPTYSYSIPGSQVPYAADLPSGLSVSINRGAAYSASENVTLYLTAENATECRYKNDEDPDWSAWEPYAEERNWTLSPGGDGGRIVAYQCRNGYGYDERQFAFASIALDRVPPAVTYSLSIKEGKAEVEVYVREYSGSNVSCATNGGEEIEVGVSAGAGRAVAVVEPAGGLFYLACADEAGNARTTPAQKIAPG